jgi:alcohol dehydrogenase (cytochrome c)
MFWSMLCQPSHAADTEWPMYNSGYDSQRYVNLDGINTKNVSRLKELCRVRVANAGSFQSGILLVDGLLYVSSALATIAIDPIDCTIAWKSIYTPEGKQTFPVNRGPAIAGGRLFRGTTDCRLLAMDAKTGAPIWKVNPCEPDAGEWFAAAPIVWDGKVFIGIAGGDWGVRGRMFAFDAATGRQLWRFNTIPVAGEFGADTWKGNSGQTGGGATWASYSLDPETGELFVPVGNPGADFDMTTRAGANLFTNSLVVLDARSGALKWWHQISSRDDKDLDLGAAPMLFTMGDGRPAVALGSKDGHLYIVDRRTHKLLSKTPVTTILNQNVPVTVQGLKTCPSVVGGVEWNGPAYDLPHHAVVVGAVDFCAFVKKSEKPEYRRGELFLGGTFELLTDPPPSGWITSIDQDTGRIRWRFHADAPVVSGVTPTAGGLIFAGDMSGNLYGLDSDDGTVRFKQNTGGAVAGGVITYRIAGQQYLAVTSGNVSRFVWGETGLPHIVIYRQDEEEKGAVGPVVAAAAKTGDVAAVGDATRGSGVYSRVCAACHGPGGEGLSGPALAGIGKRKSVDEIAAWVMNPVSAGNPAGASAMPRLYPSVLTGRDVRDVARFVSHF